MSADQCYDGNGHEYAAADLLVLLSKWDKCAMFEFRSLEQQNPNIVRTDYATDTHEFTCGMPLAWRRMCQSKLNRTRRALGSDRYETDVGERGRPC